MYCNAVLSSLGGWDILTKQHPSVYDSLIEALAGIDYTGSPQNEKINSQDIHHDLNVALEKRKWQINVQITLKGGKNTFYTIDFLNDKIGGKLILGKKAFILSSMLANFPMSMRLCDIEMAFILVPMRSFKEMLSVGPGVAEFEYVRDILEGLPPLSIRYPFVIMGFSQQDSEMKVEEMTSGIDQYLLSQVGFTLQEMILLGERPRYDFKEKLTSRPDGVTKEVCAMANLRRGGLILLGISDGGDIVGVNNADLDDIQLRMTNSIRNLCKPIPDFEFLSFPVNEKKNSSLLICRIMENRRKPCLVRGRAYVRSGPSAHPADAEEIRKMVFS